MKTPLPFEPAREYPSPSPWRLQGQRALVTGGSKGIGQAIVEEFLSLGAEVMVVARESPAFREQVQTWNDRWQPQGIIPVEADLSTEVGRQQVSDRLRDTWDGLEILVNNAGTNLRKSTLEYTATEYDRLVQLNQLAAFDLCCRCHPYLKQKNGFQPTDSSAPPTDNLDTRNQVTRNLATRNLATHSIVNVGSVYGIRSGRTGIPYAMTKAALHQMTRSLAVEWAMDGIRVNTVAPGVIRTPLTAQALADPERLQAIVASRPLQRVGEPVEVARVVAFLCMEAAAYVTGECVAVDGGFLAFGF